MIFSKLPKKYAFHNLKRIRIGTWKFVIRKINPLLDFTADNIPQIFSAFFSKRPTQSETVINLAMLQRAQEDMKLIVQAGLVKPELVAVGKGDQRGKENGITVDDIFRDEETAVKLYIEILSHSLNKFKGLKGLFFSIKIKHTLFTEWQKNIRSCQAILSSQMESAR